MKGLCVLMLTICVIILLCMTVWLRNTIENPAIHRDLLWSYNTNQAPFMTTDSVYNILVFIPIGILVGVVSSRYKLLNAFMVGLFVSETIECLQLIYKKGSFDVDDLFNNTLGAFIGGLLVEMFVLFKKKV